jgi:hypothetical protein
MTTYREDFREISHCGGKMYFKIGCDGEGKKSISTGWTANSPKNFVVVGLYADLGSGDVVSDFLIGGIGQANRPQPPPNAISILLGSDSHARWGHECPPCNSYFRSAHHPAIYPLTCAYCGLQADAHYFLTNSQRKYVNHCVSLVVDCVNYIQQGETKEVVIDMDDAVDLDASQPKPEFYYVEKGLQTEFNCNKCGEYNDIRGRYGYCSNCGWKSNGSEFRAKCQAIRGGMNDSSLQPDSALRAIVSEFDACCRDFSTQIRNRIPMKPARRKSLEKSFQDLGSDSVSILKLVTDIDLMKSVSDTDKAFLNLMMHRRHVFEHLGGVADQRYIQESGDTNCEVGDLLRENRESVHRFVGLLNRITDNFECDFHEIFMPTEWPINEYEKFKLRQANN